MKRISLLSFLLILFLGCSTLKKTSSNYIELERGPCFGSCADYKVTLFQNGNIVFKGTGFVTEKESRKTRVAAYKINYLLAKSDTIKFYSFPNNIDDVCVSDMTDKSRTRITIKSSSGKKTVQEQTCGLIFDDYLPFLEARYSETELDSVINQNKKAKIYLNAFHAFAREIDSIASSGQMLDELIKN